MHPVILTLVALSILGPDDEAAGTRRSSPPSEVVSAVLAVPRRSPLPEVSVEIDVSALDRADAREMEMAVRGRTELVLDEREYFLDEAATDAIVVRIGYGHEEGHGYQAHIYVYEDGQLVAPGEERLVCDSCSPSRVAELYADCLAAALDRLAAANAARAEQELVPDEPPATVELPATVEPPATIEPPLHEVVMVEPAPQPSPSLPTVEAPPSRGRRLALRNAGLATVIPGSLALGAGVGLVLVGHQPVDQDDDLQIVERHFRPPGIAVAAAGGVATVAGLAMLLRSARLGSGKRRASERLGWGPVLGTRAGVVLLGKF
jgi:hypothetical protein